VPLRPVQSLLIRVVAVGPDCCRGDRIPELNGPAVHQAGQVIRGVRLPPDGGPLCLPIKGGGRRLRLQRNLPAGREPGRASRDNGLWSGVRSRPAPWPSPGLIFSP